MPRIVTALFEDRAAAERALQALMGAGVGPDRIAIIGESRAREVSSISGFRELSVGDDTLAELRRLGLPDADTQLFEEGLRRGCALLTARIDSPDFAETIQVIEMFDPIDLDRRSQDWLQSRPAGGAGAGGDAGAPLGAGITGGSGGGTSTVEALPGMGTVVNDTSSLGTADLHTQEMTLSDQGRSTTDTGGQRADVRAGAPGVRELGGRDGRPGAHQREGAGTGRVRTYMRNDR